MEEEDRWEVAEDEAPNGSLITGTVEEGDRPTSDFFVSFPLVLSSCPGCPSVEGGEEEDETEGGGLSPGVVLALGRSVVSARPSGKCGDLESSRSGPGGGEAEDLSASAMFWTAELRRSLKELNMGYGRQVRRGEKGGSGGMAEGRKEGLRRGGKWKVERNACKGKSARRQGCC